MKILKYKNGILNIKYISYISNIIKLGEFTPYPYKFHIICDGNDYEIYFGTEEEAQKRLDFIIEALEN